MNRWHTVCSFLVAIIAALFLWCTADKPIEPDGQTDESRKGLYGKLVDEEGRPASGASVKAIEAGATVLNKAAARSMALSSGADSVFTDDSGYYTFESLDEGTYNLRGDYDHGNLIVLITGIEYDSAGTVQEVQTDTLRAPGQVAGVVNTGTENDGGVMCYIPGISFIAVTDDTGRFVLSDIPQGRYRVTYRREQLKTASDTGIEVRAGEMTMLAMVNMEADTVYPPPVPGGLAVVSYDTLHGCVVLNWNQVFVDDLVGYVVFRNDTASKVPVRVVDELAVDTTYIDTIFHDRTDTTSRVVAYRLKAQDKESNMSMAYSKAVVVNALSPAKVRTVISFTLLNTRNDTASINDTVGIAASWRNATRRNVRLEWFVDADDSPVKTVDDIAFAGEDTVSLSWSDASVKKVYLSAIDEGGSVWRDSVSIPIVQDIPVADAGKDTTALATDTVPLHGTAVQRFGTIAKWEWRIGSGDWSETGGPDTVVVLSPMNATVVCSLAVTDDDGSRGTDEVSVKFIPKIKNVYAGEEYSLVLMEDGVLFGCGKNGDGQLGFEGGDESRLIQIMDHVQTACCGGRTSFILKTDGTLWACGSNESHLLGTDTIRNAITPMQIMSDIVDVSAGPGHLLVLKTDSTLWGYGSCLAIGDSLGAIYGSFTIETKLIMNDVASMSAGTIGSMILKKDNTLWVCGYNDAGQLGLDSMIDCFKPIQIMSEVNGMSANRYHSLILKTDNTLWICGCATNCETGGTNIVSKAPKRIMNDVQSVAAGYLFSMVIKTDGTLWGFGENSFSQLGDGTMMCRESPVPIMSDVKSVAAGFCHSLILKTDNTLWACGNNECGELGDGTTINRAIPVQITIPVE